jgi:hypothetical protein
MSKNGLILLKPTTVDKTGASSTATISALGSVEFGSCETLSLNGVFSADYDNYMVIVRDIQTSGTQNFLGRFRVGGTDNSTASSYTSQELTANGTSVTGAIRNVATSGYFVTSSSVQYCGSVLHFYGPYLAQPTAWRQVTANGYLSATIFDTAGTHNQSVAYDGFSIITPTTTTLSGRIAVYGMRK